MTTITFEGFLKQKNEPELRRYIDEERDFLAYLEENPEYHYQQDGFDSAWATLVRIETAEEHLARRFGDRRDLPAE